MLPVVLLQVLANDPPMLPYQLFRLLAQQAYVTNASAIAAQASGAASAGSAYYAPAGADGGSGFGAEDFDLGTPADQGLGPDLFGGAQDDDEGGVVEDADISAWRQDGRDNDSNTDLGGQESPLYIHAYMLTISHHRLIAVLSLLLRRRVHCHVQQQELCQINRGSPHYFWAERQQCRV